MNFFARQENKRRQSLVLLVLFFMTVLVIGLLIHGAVVGLSMLLGENSNPLKPSALAMALVALFWLTILAGSFFRLLDVRGGGDVLAERFGASRASSQAGFSQQVRLLNAVAEMAISSSTVKPEVYVMRGESSINAFVLGRKKKGYVIVLTDGALDAFDQAELQAVIAHEFAHIHNGDVPLNMRLLIVLGGLMAIDELGKLLISQTRLKFFSRDEPVRFHPGVLVGYLLRVMGSIGVFFGQLIQAALTRKREYLADASAIQFTRNPIALASALDIIAQRVPEPALHNRQASELVHLCFQSGSKSSGLYRLLSSHPSLESRIKMVEPHFAVKRRKLRKRDIDLKPATQSHSENDVMAANIGGLDAISGLVGKHRLTHPSANDGKIVVSNFTGEISDRIALLLPDEVSGIAVLFALFTSDNELARQRYFNSIASSLNQQIMGRVKEIYKLIPDELNNNPLGIIEHAGSVLCKTLKHQHRQRIMLKLETLLAENGYHDLMSYITLQVIRRKLAVEFPLIKTIATTGKPLAQGSRVKSFDAMGSEFTLLLSLLVETSGASPRVADSDFERVLRCYTQTRYPRRTASEEGIVHELEQAFQTLYVQPKSIRQAFIRHCQEIVQYDGYAARTERALLGLFAASLGCEDLAA